MNRILVSTDFSDTAAAAFRPAVELARSFGSEITVAYVLDRLTYNTGYPYLDLSEYQAKVEELARRSLDKAVSDLRELGAEKVRGIYRVGTPHVELLREAAKEEEGYDLVIVATHGLSGFRRFILGSTTERIVRKSRLPVLAVHAESPDRPFQVRRILFPTDLSSTSAEALPYAAAMAAHFSAQLELFHVFEDPTSLPPVGPGYLGPGYLMPSADEIQRYRNDCVEQLETKAKSLPLRDATATWRIAEDAHPAEAIVEHAKDGGFDLIITPSHGRRGLEHMFLGSVAERVVRFAEVPVLVVKPARFHVTLPDIEVEPPKEDR